MKNTVTIMIETLRWGPTSDSVFQVLWYFGDDRIGTQTTICKGITELNDVIGNIKGIR